MNRFTFTGAFGRFFRTLGDDFGRFALLTMLGLIAPMLAISFGLERLTGITAYEWKDRLNGMTNDNWYFVVGAVVLSAVIRLINLSMVTEIAILRASGKPAKLGKAFTDALGNILPLIGVSIVTGLIVLGGTLLLIVPGIIWALATMVAVPALVGQPGLGVGGAVSRSFELTRNHRWLLLGILIVAALFLFVVGIGYGLSEGLIPAATDWGIVTRRVVDIVFDGAIDAVTNIFMAAIYVGLRLSKEKTAPDTAAEVFT